MFLGVILICGLGGGNPALIEQGCTPMTSNKVFPTEEMCVMSLRLGIDQFEKADKPDTAFISDLKCVELSPSA